MIVVVLLGILAVCVIINTQAYATETKETASKESLRILRDTIQLYSAQHGDVPPGYTDNDPTQSVDYAIFLQQVVQDGRYLPKPPKNPFNESSVITILDNDEPFPAEASDDSGWIYKPATKQVRLNSPDTDDEGVRYYDY